MMTMTINAFAKRVNLGDMKEIQKVETISYYLCKKEKVNEISVVSVVDMLIGMGFSKPNESRLNRNLAKSRNFLKGTKNGYFRLHNALLQKLEVSYSFLNEHSDDIVTMNSVLPEDLYKDTRGYIFKLAIQINASYEHNISDGCAILMRRLLEVLLILGYRAKGKEHEIQDGVNYKNLTSIIDYTISNKILALHKDTKEVLHDFRLLGNFSAHGITYNCRKEELTKVMRKYRFAVEDLLYSAEIKK
jgi:hypothetical protein